MLLLAVAGALVRRVGVVIRLIHAERTFGRAKIALCLVLITLLQRLLAFLQQEFGVVHIFALLCRAIDLVLHALRLPRSALLIGRIRFLTLLPRLLLIFGRTILILGDAVLLRAWWNFRFPNLRVSHFNRNAEGEFGGSEMTACHRHVTTVQRALASFQKLFRIADILAIGFGLLNRVLDHLLLLLGVPAEKVGWKVPPPVAIFRICSAI